MTPPRRVLPPAARLMMAFAVCSLVLAGEPAFAGTSTRVLDRKGVEEREPAASQGYLVWGQFDRRGADTFVKPDGEPRIQMNSPGTFSLGAGIEDTTAVFDRFQRNDSDLRMFDVLAETRSAPPAGVNTQDSEYQPAISGDWLFFTRDSVPSDGVRNARVRVILFNTSTSEERVLANLRWRTHFLTSNQVNGDWATFESCDSRREFSNCQVFLYQISTDELTEIPNPGKQQYGSAVTSDGTLYFARSASGDHWLCGVGVRILRLPDGGTEEVIATIRRRRDVFSSFALEESGGSVTLLFGRGNCKTDASGIYEIANADTAT